MTEPKIRYDNDGPRYRVFWGDDRIGFVACDPGRRKAKWNAVDTTMAWSQWFTTREQAGAGLLRKFKQQIASGEIG